MNIFIMVLAVLFMAGYYFMDSPSQRVAQTELEQAITHTDLRSIAECAATAHTAAIKNYTFDDICIQQYQITSDFICLNERQSITKCEIIRNKKPAYSFIVTSTGLIPPDDYNSMLEVIESYYKNAGTFGIFLENAILGGGSSGKRAVPQSIIKTANLTDGQLVYMTQYEIPDIEVEYQAPNVAEINCPAGSIKVYRFSKWQCVARNEKTSCSGDRIWDSTLMECVPDNSRRPLCASRQTAVMVDDLWECVDPFLDRNCPSGMIARLNYNTLEWECIEDPSTAKPPKKCTPRQGNAIIATRPGSTLRIPTTNCTDCEEMYVDPDTCITSCIPNPAKVNDPRCYPDRRHECVGSSRAFYFGFPNADYIKNVSAIAGYNVPLDSHHSQNRKFNCLDCGERRIDQEKSLPPYIAVCE